MKNEKGKMPKATKEDYDRYKKYLLNKIAEEDSWIKSELDFLTKFKVKVNYDDALKQVIKLNSKYRTHLSRGLNKAADECGELASYIVSDNFQSRVMTNDINVAIGLVNDLRQAAKTRGRDLMSFATKYCHHCNPNMYPIYDSLNKEYLEANYGYKCQRDYKEFIDAYYLFCKDIGVYLPKELDKLDKNEGFWIDKYINNINK